jgi:hypothetical protein
MWTAATAQPYPGVARGIAMNEIRTRIQVSPDHTISGVAPLDVPPGEHVATITISAPQTSEKLSSVIELPVHDTPWDGSISLRREDMYGDDAR